MADETLLPSEAKTEEEHVYGIPSWNTGILHKKIERLNKKAAKLNCPPLVLTEKGTQKRVHPDYLEQVEMGVRPAGDVPHYTVHLFTISGEGPKLAGWKFIGTLDHHTLPGSVIVNTVPGEKVPEEFYHNDAVCNHCNKIRRRIETFVVEHEEGEMKQVGRQCIRDFLGTDPATILRLLTSIRRLFESLEDEESEFYAGGGGGRQSMVFNLERSLEVTSAMIRTYGWVSKAMAEQDYDNARTPTVFDVLHYFCPPYGAKERREWEQWKETINFHDEEDANNAVNAIKWLEEQESDNEYMHNLRAIASSEACPDRLMGYWCSLMATYQRAMDRLREAARQKKLNEHVGEIKKRQDFDIELLSIKCIDGYYGVVHIHKMLDNEGRTLTWFANTDSGMEAGRKYRIKGTVKKHDEYNGWKQTALSRVKVIEEITE